MRNLVFGIVAAMLVSAAPAGAAPKLAPEAKLAQALEGRIAGQPVDCINLRTTASSEVVKDAAILYRSGNTVYVNRPRSGAEDLNNWDALVTRTFSSQLCSGDVVEMVDTASGMMTGLVFLGEFVPYKRVR